MNTKTRLIVVKTCGFEDHPDKPADAVVAVKYWHIGDGDWTTNMFVSVEELILYYLNERGWKLIQWTRLKEPHEHELIFACKKNQFMEVEL
jgi:hypothetical protein